MTRTRSIFLASLALLLSPVAANAAIITYDINVSGTWSDTANPFDMPFSPTLEGDITVDNSFSGLESVVSFSIMTGTKTWTLAEFSDSWDNNEVTFDGAGNMLRFTLGYFFDGLGGRLFISSANSMSVREESGIFNFCNNCVSFSRSASVPESVPEPGTLALLGIGLLGLRAARRRRT